MTTQSGTYSFLSLFVFKTKMLKRTQIVKMNEHSHWPMEVVKPPPLDRPEPKSDLPSAIERIPNQRTLKVAFKGDALLK